MLIIDGQQIANKKRELIKAEIKQKNLSPELAIILANENPASKIYVGRKIKACEEVGITPHLYKFPTDCSEKDLTDLINKLNNDNNINGIFLQLPIGDHLDSLKIIQSIDPKKDVDGLTYHNLGGLMAGNPDLIACTPQGVMELLNSTEVNLTGKHAVIIGRSLLFGKPMGQLLLQANCTVTQCHSKTVNLPEIAKQADILIAATGQPQMVKSNWVKQNAIIIDVGISQNSDGKIVGDVDFDDVKNIASHITPVPKGVGPMTVAYLLANTVKASIL